MHNPLPDIPAAPALRNVRLPWLAFDSTQTSLHQTLRSRRQASIPRPRLVGQSPAPIWKLSRTWPYLPTKHKAVTRAVQVTDHSKLSWRSDQHWFRDAAGRMEGRGGNTATAELAHSASPPPAVDLEALPEVTARSETCWCLQRHNYHSAWTPHQTVVLNEVRQTRGSVSFPT